MQKAIAVLIIVFSVLVCFCQAAGNKSRANEWQSVFDVNKAGLADRGANKYFILEPGYKLNFKNARGDTLVITVLDKTKEVDGVKTRVVEERETKDGKLVEISRNYFAIDKYTKAVYYFGEDVAIYENGKIRGNEGSWLAGHGNKFGLMMPGQAKVGHKFYQEQAPKIAMDRCEILSATTIIKTSAGTFRNCLHVQDSSDLKAGKSDKVYAPGVGLVKDDDMLLEKIEKPAKEKE